MNVIELINELTKAEDAGHGLAPVVGLRRDGEVPPQTIHAVEAEWHQDGDGSYTIWLMLEEV